MSAKCCHHLVNATAFVSGELSLPEQADFARHLPACPVCQAEVETTQRLIGRLTALPTVTASAGLTARILTQMQNEAFPSPARPRFWRKAVAMAAVITLFAGGLSFRAWHRSNLENAASLIRNENVISVSRALDWFCDNQEPDGSWNAEKWEGNPRFASALTALPLIVLLEGQRNAQRDEAVQRAMAYLQSQQNADGTFSENFREAPYIHGVATLALLRAYERQPSPELKQRLDSALRIVFATQTRDGGWGYQNVPAPNLPVTLWHKEVVECAAALGWPQAKPSLARVHDWLESNLSEEILLEEMSSDGRTDYHRAYFAVATLRGRHTTLAQHQIESIRHRLVMHQAASGRESGSWNPSDQWARTGGRIYATAMASLTLH